MTMTSPVTSQRILVDNDLIYNPFKSWLKNKNYSSSTIRNYLSDINQFLNFTSNQDIFSSETVSLYLKNISKDSNYSRYLSSLSKFFQFAQDQKLINNNPLKTALKAKKPSTDEIINQYSEYLKKKQFSQSTVKNYLNDIKQFIDWSTNPPVSLYSTSSLKESGSLKTAPFVKGSCPEQSEGLRGFKFFKSIFRKKEGFSES